jgi:hypothetical protein
MNMDFIVNHIDKRTGYEIRHGHVNGTAMDAAFTTAGDYIGDAKDAERLIDKRGIAPEPRMPGQVCSIGFCERDQKWYGWSHRGIAGFGIGDVAKKSDGFTTEFRNDPERMVPVGFTAKTLADARRMAEAFAESVS